MWCWLARLEGGRTSPEEQSEKRVKLEETHTANEVRPRTKEWIGVGEAPIETLSRSSYSSSNFQGRIVDPC
jgi:hypothetical protein